MFGGFGCLFCQGVSGFSVVIVFFGILFMNVVNGSLLVFVGISSLVGLRDLLVGWV